MSWRMPSACDRCGKEPIGASIMSRFNTETICLECKRRERQHPKYAAAEAAEVQAVRAGIRNFPGVGCPADLYRPEEA